MASDDDAVGAGLFPIRPGDWLLCENGHRMWRARIEVTANMTLQSAHFEDADGKSPEPRSQAVCPVCGVGAFRVRDGGGVEPCAIERAPVN